MDKKKVTRRAAIAAAVGGVAASPFIISALRDKYEVTMPDGPSAGTFGGKTITIYEGREITIEMPRMEVRTPEDEESYKAIMVEKLKKNPQFIEANKLRVEKWKEESLKSAIAQIDETEKSSLEEIARAVDMGEEEKRALTKQIKEAAQASRTQISETIAKADVPPIQ